MSDMNCLNNENELISELDFESQIESGLGNVVEVSKVYEGSESDEIIVEVNNEKNTITATLKKMWFSSFNEFPEIGSESLIYADKSTGILYTYNKETGGYDKLIAEPDLRSVSINGVKVEPDENKNADIPMATKDKLGVVMVDESVSDNSTNPVQNNVIKEYIDEGDNAIYEEINGLSGEIGSTNQEVVSVKEELTKTNTTVSSLEKSAQDTINQLAEVEERIATNESGIQAINTELGNKANKSDIPTKLSQLTNDKSFIDNTVNNLINYYTKTETYTKDQVNSLISQIPKFNVQVVTVLPTSGISTTTIYLLATEDGEQNNYYEEYIYVNTQWELLGTTKVDLSEYAKVADLNKVSEDVSSIKTSVSTLQTSKVDKVTGKDLSTNDFTDNYKTQVDNNTSARHTHSNKTILDATTASFTTEDKTKLDGISAYDDTEIKNQLSALSTNKQDKLTAGDNIVIENNVISSVSSGAGVNIVQTTGDSIDSIMSQKAVTDELDNKLQKSEFGIYVGSNDACSDSEGNFGQCSNIYNSDGTFYTSRQFLFDKDDFVQSGEDSEKTYSISENIARKTDLDEYVPKKTTTEGVVKAYVINGTNGEDVCLVSMTGEAGAIARYSTSGQFNVTKDPENANSVTRKIWVETQLDTKVDKEEGKGLSTNDFTDEEQLKLHNLENYDDTAVKNLISAESTARQSAIDEVNEQVTDLYNVVDKTAVTDASVSQTTTQANINLTKTNIKSGTTSSKTISIPSATSSTAGLLSANDQTIGGKKTFNGDVTIGGNLNVTGTTTTISSTTLQVEDKLIEVAHGNTVSLTTPAGIFAPKYDGTNDGALVFDSTGTAYVGDVKLNTNGDIDVSTSDLQPLATRGALTNGNLTQWNETKKTLEDSGTSVSALTSSINAKQTQLTTAQLNAVNSGITSTKVSTYDGYASSINAKYTKPTGGIPKTDLASAVQSSLTKADSALQEHQDISGKQDKLTAGSNITITNNTISATVPTVNNGTLTITQNGTTKGTFTANQSGNVTIALTDNNTTYDVATTTANGLMSASDKSKLSEIDTKMDKENPTGTGSFSLNRHEDTTIGESSFTEGIRNTASGHVSHAEGQLTTASGPWSHSEGSATTASGDYSHAEGSSSIASGKYSHAEGNTTTASGNHSHAEGAYTTASGNFSHAEGYETIASGKHSHVSGRYNIEDTEDKYAEIIGNGTSDSRSNARTLDWEGNEWIAGKYTCGANNDEVALKSAIPTKTSDLTNDSGFVDSSKVSLGNWTISTDSDGNLVFNNSGVAVFKINTSGKVDVLSLDLVDTM